MNHSNELKIINYRPSVATEDKIIEGFEGFEEFEREIERIIEDVTYEV